MPPLLALGLLLQLLHGGAPRRLPADQPLRAEVEPVEPALPDAPGQPRRHGSSPAPSDEVAEAPAEVPASGEAGLLGFGLDRPSCGAAGCRASEFGVAVGLGSSNFGGFGMGLELRSAFIDANRGALQGKGEVAFATHVNGIGQGDPSGHPSQGELGVEGQLGFGLLSPLSLSGGLRPYAMLNALAGKAGSFDGATLFAYLPNFELGMLGRSAGGSALQLALHAGGNFFYADGPLSRLASGSELPAGALSHGAGDPYFAADLRTDLRLGGTSTLRLIGQAAWTPDSLGHLGTRQIWWGKAAGYIQFGALFSGPSLTFFSPDRQPLGLDYVGNSPETSFLWVLGI